MAIIPTTFLVKSSCRSLSESLGSQDWLLTVAEQGRNQVPLMFQDPQPGLQFADLPIPKAHTGVTLLSHLACDAAGRIKGRWGCSWAKGQQSCFWIRSQDHSPWVSYLGMGFRKPAPFVLDSTGISQYPTWIPKFHKSNSSIDGCQIIIVKVGVCTGEPLFCYLTHHYFCILIFVSIILLTLQEKAFYDDDDYFLQLFLPFLSFAPRISITDRRTFLEIIYLSHDFTFLLFYFWNQGEFLELHFNFIYLFLCKT